MREIRVLPNKRVILWFGFPICRQDNVRTPRLISMELGGGVQHKKRQNPFEFGVDRKHNDGNTDHFTLS